MSWKNEGGKRVNSIIDSTQDITNKYYSTDPTISTNDKEGVYFYKESGTSVVGFGTKTPYSRLSFGDYNVNNLDSNGNNKNEEIANNASIALSEKADGSNATGISFFREGTVSAETRGIRFTINNNKTGTVQQTSLEKMDQTNTSLMLLNDGTSQKVLMNSVKSLFSNTRTGLEVNGDIHLTKNLVFDINQSSSTVLKKEGTLFYDSVEKVMKWITGTGADIRTIPGKNDTAFAIDSSKYDASFSVIVHAESETGLLAFKDLGLCIGNGEMLISTYLGKFTSATKQHLPALSILGHHQNGVVSNANVLISEIGNVTGEAILSKTSSIDLSANGVIYLLNNLTIDKYEPEAVIDVSKINVPFLSMGSDITNYNNSIVIGEDISGSSNSFYFGKSINNLATYNPDASFNFVFGDTISIDSNAINFDHNFIFGSQHSSIGGDHNFIFGESLSTANDVSFCMLLGNGAGSAQKGDLIKYFQDGDAVFHLKSGGNLILGGDISANDASFNNVVFSNIGNETSKIKLAYVKGISAENVTIENSLTIGGKLNSTSDISANDASFNNIDINNLKSYGNFVVNGNMDATGYANFGGHANFGGYANFGGDISANDASFNNIDINNLKSYGNFVVNGNMDATGYANFGGDISANNAIFNTINIDTGDINELENVQKINFDSTSNLLIQKSNSNIVTINQTGMSIAGILDANSLTINNKPFDAEASSSWVSGNSKNYSGNSNALYIPIKVGVNFVDVSGNNPFFFPKFPLDVSGVIRSQNQIFGHLSIDLVPQPLSGYTNTITNKFYGSGIYDASENDINASNPVWKLFDSDDTTYWESTGSEDTITGISGGDVSITGKYLEIKLPERCTLKHYAFKRDSTLDQEKKLPKVWTIIGKIGVDDEVSNFTVNNSWKVIDYKTESVQYGADGDFVYFTVDNLKYSNDMYKVFRIYITETFNGTTVGTQDINECRISELKLFGEPSNITDISSSLIQTELFDISGALFKQKHLSLQPLGGNVGIRNNNPSVILDISSSNAIRLPMGNTFERPVDASGCLRYNTETKQFEGYGDAGWAGLGGVIDKDQDTYIAAEENTDEDMLRFYTSGLERMVINDSGVVDVSGLLQSKEISGNSVNTTMLKTDGLIINNKTIALNNITNSGGFHVNSKVGYFDISSVTGVYLIDGFPNSTIYAYPGSVLQFNLDNVTNGHPFNIFKGGTASTTGIDVSGLQHVADDGTITTDAAAQANTSGTLMWFVPYNAVGLYRYQCSVHASMNGHINILPMPSDVSANDISGGHVFANSLMSNGIVINGDISGNTATFANGIINTDLGIGTSSPLVSLDIIGTDAIRIPVGNDTNEKPSGADGMIRYNNVSNQFEGYGGTAWAGLGGVIDKDLDTKVVAEQNDDEDKLRFITEGTERMIITDSDNSGNIGIHTSTPSVTLDISSNNAIRLPMGNNNARPSNADASGCLRYNTETKQFEGYGEGSWGGLGGVISLNMQTKITAEDAGGLTFFTDGQKRMNIDNTGNIDISSAVTINNNLDLSGNLDCSSAVIEILTSDSTYVKDLSCSELNISGILKTDGLIINNKTIALNNITNSGSFHVNSKVGYFDITSFTGAYLIDGFPNRTIYAYPGSVLQFNLDNVTNGHPFNIFKGASGNENKVTFTINSQNIIANQGDIVTQGSSSGILHSALNGSTSSFVIISDWETTFNTDVDNIIIQANPPVTIDKNNINNFATISQSIPGLQHVADDGTITTDAAAQANTSGTLMWFVPYDAVGLYRYQCSVHASMNGHINILPMPSDVSANDISGGHVFANSLMSNGIVINGDISGNTATFANGIMNTVAISDNLDCSNAFIKNLDCSSVFITDLSANDISGGHVFANTLTIAGDLSGNNARLYDVSVNRLWIGDVEMIGHIPGDISGPTNTGTLTGNMIFNGDLSGNDASFNVVDVKQLSISESSLNLGSGEVPGNIKYESGKFYGYNESKWAGLGGVISDNEKVTITAHDSNGLQFYTSSDGLNTVESMRILNNGQVNIGDITNVEAVIGLKANIASPSFTGTVSGITPVMVGLGNVTNESKATMFASPSFTGTVYGITSIMVGLGNVTNESKATMFASPSFTGDVGIGETNPGAKLQVNGNIKIKQTANIGNTSSTYANGLVFEREIGGLNYGYYMGYSVHGGAFSMGQYHATAPTTYNEFFRANGNIIYLNPDNDNTLVGIGTSSPGLPLDVHGSYIGRWMGKSSPSGYKHEAAARDSFYMGRWDGPNAMHNTDGCFLGMELKVDTASEIGAVGGTNSNQSAIRFHTWGSGLSNSREVMRIDSAGNVGIGTTSPDAKLQVNGDFHIEGTSDAWSNTGKGLYFRFHNDTGDGYIQCVDYTTGIYYGLQFDALDYDFKTNGVTKMFIKSDGNVGIGTTSPDSALHVKTSSQFKGIFLDDENGLIFKVARGTSTSTPYMNMYSDSGTVAKVSIGVNQKSYFNGGNVGIGTTSPAAKLDVNGTMKVTGEMTLNWNKQYMFGNFDSNWGLKGVDSGGAVWTEVRMYGYAQANRGFRVNNTTPSGTRGAHGGEIPFCVTGQGRVGIGTTSPQAGLDINTGTSNVTIIPSYAQYLGGANTHGINWWGGGDNRNSYGGWALVVRKEAAFASHLFVYSDNRIKTNIVDVEDNQALQMLRNIPCRYYEYKDKVAKGYDKTIGFIAQEVKEVLPMAVKFLNAIIPNEMRKLEDVSWNGFDMSSDLQDISGVKYRFYVSNDISGNEVMKEVVGNEDNTFTFDQSWNNVFCYGKEVDDFHTLDKNKLFALNFSATQEIDRIQQAEKTKLEEQTSKLTATETKLEAAEAKIATLENTLADVLTRLTALE